MYNHCTIVNYKSIITEYDSAHIDHDDDSINTVSNNYISTCTSNYVTSGSACS